MAEGSNDFTVSIPVDADFSRFRATAQKEIEAFQKTGATIPVGATAGFAGASGAVSSTSVAAAAQNAVQMALAPVNAFPGNPGGALAVAGGHGVFGGTFGGNFGGPPPSLLNIPNAPAGPGSALSMLQYGGVTPSGGVMGPDGTIHDERTFWSNQMWEDQIGQLSGPAGAAGTTAAARPRTGRGFGMGGRFLALGMLHAAGRSAMALMEHGREEREADGDPTGLARADMAYQKRMADAFPIAGQLGYALREYVTRDNEDIERTLRDAEEGDKRTGGMRKAGELHGYYSAARQMAGSFGGVERARISGGVEYNKALRDLQQSQIQMEASVGGPFRQQRADLDTEVTEFFKKHPEMKGIGPIEAEIGRRYKQIEDEKSAALAKVRAPFESDRDAAAAVRDRAILDAERARNAARYTAEGETRSSYYRTRNQPFTASLSERMTRMGLDIFNAEPENRAAVAQQGMQGMAEEAVQFGRQFGSQQRALAAEQAVMSRILARDPLGASIARITGARDQALQEAQSLPWGFRQIRQGAIRAAAGLQEQVERQDYNDRTGMRTRALQADVDITGLEAGGQEKTAHAEAIKRRAEMAAEASRQAGEPAGNQRLIMQAALNEERTYLRELKRRGDQGSAQEVYPGMFGPGATAGQPQEPVVDAVKNVERVLQDIKAALTGAN